MRSRLQPEIDPYDMTLTGAALGGIAYSASQKIEKAPSADEQPSPRLSPWERRQQAASARRHGPDTIPGLATYFEEHCPRPEYGRGLYVSNYRGLMATFSDLRRQGITPEICRALVDLYFLRLGTTAPKIAPCWDFKARRYALLRDLTATGITATAEDYTTWHTQAPASTEDYASSWGIS